MPLNAFQTTDSTDDASPVIVGSTYPAMQSVIIDTAATGDYVDVNGRSAANDAAVSVRIPNGDASAVISAGAEITVSEFALVEIVTGVSSSASGVENRQVFTTTMPYNSATDPGYTASSQPFIYPAVPITLANTGKYSFEVHPFQTTTSLENGTRTGGTFELKDSGGTVLGSIYFLNINIDQTNTNYPYAGGSQTVVIDNLPAGNYTLNFTGNAGVGGGNRNSSNGYVNVITKYEGVKTVVSPEDLAVTNPAEVDTNTVLRPNGDGTATFKSSGTIYNNIADQPVPDTNYNTYAVDLPALEAGDQFTVVMARGVLIYNLIGRFIGFGYEHEFIFDGIVWRIEIVGTQLRIEAFSGGGSQAVKAIFIER